MLRILPKPVGEFLSYPSEIAQAYANKDQYSGISGIKAGYNANKLVALSLRTALALVGMLAIAHTGGSIGVALCLGAVVSLPATFMAIGGDAAYLGVMLAVNSVALSSYSLLGLVTALAGLKLLDTYDIWEIGLAESYVIQPLANAAGSKVESMFNPC